MKLSPEQKQEGQKNLISSMKFFAVACPCVLVYAGIPLFHAMVDAPAYRHDCSNAAIAPSFSPSNAPCYYVAASSILVTDRDHRGRVDSQDIQLAYDGKVSEIETDHDPILVSPSVADPRLSDQSVNGPCLFEVWHNKIVLVIIKSGARIQVRNNPEIETGPIASGGFVAMLVSTILIWAYLLKHRSK